jgi:predicted short-subunit dehydrogenase-like oxidoreductase (DUF2520 family)
MAALASLGFIGAGRVGSTLAVALHRAGYTIAAIHSRRLQSAQALAAQAISTAVETAGDVAAQADLVFITTGDAAIAAVCELVVGAGGWRAGQAVVHCSGALGRGALVAAAGQGALTGCLHPLQTFPSVEIGLANLPGSFFGVEAEEPLLSKLHRIIHDLGGQPLDLRGQDRALYHTAAVMASNYTVTLFAAAVRLLGEIGVAPHEAESVLLPLLRGAVTGLEREGLPGALTGPIARGDTPIVEEHLHALATHSPELLPLYRALAAVTLPLALARGLDPALAAQIGQALANASTTWRK